MKKSAFALLLCVPLLSASCFVDADDDDADPEACRTECDDAHGACVVDCNDDNACVLACDTSKTDCDTDCD